jgi:hypothetical protein
MTERRGFGCARKMAIRLASPLRENRQDTEPTLTCLAALPFAL